MKFLIILIEIHVAIILIIFMFSQNTDYILFSIILQIMAINLKINKINEQTK